MTHTCCALSSAHGKAGISVIRLSGDDAFEIASKVFFPANGKKLSEIPANKAVYGEIRSTDNEKIDTGIAVCFYAPHSYTGENTVEISCHGSPVGVSAILAQLFAAGAKPALAGEFTKRAFVNGKLDLTQAEAVAELLDAESMPALKLSGAKLDGGLGRSIRKISDEITLILASVYAYIDYPDEDMSDLSDEEIKEKLENIGKKLETLKSTYSSGLAVTKGIKTVIAGLPNTGKSTFFNMLSGYDRAIVTEIAGTTRDVISESLMLGDVKLLVSDTAGIRKTEDKIEKIGVERSKEALEDCELVFALFDVSKELSDEDKEFAKEIASPDKNVIVILNKSDIAVNEGDTEKMKEFFKSLGLDRICVVSAEKNEGKDDVEKEVASLYNVSKEELESGCVLTNARQYAAVSSAKEAVDRAKTALETLTRDVSGLDLEQALSFLCEADGRQVSEAVVDSIFSHFCVGK
ncbi:MAG: tRNA uridine-5-carboxymethylaminomethyl(34) synthesis GTPase MnmE [Clostridia bacterium]|nr:tRNA uridine-5-carboxymethylaminomethyl(34) synthesis GTPase MnmE [Clostridia bacterium]